MCQMSMLTVKYHIFYLWLIPNPPKKKKKQKKKKKKKDYGELTVNIKFSHFFFMNKSITATHFIPKCE